MARMPRLVVPGYPHHVTQRGNRRMKTFFSERDYQAYIDFLLEGLKLSGTEVWAYCLMPNHVHFIVVPNSEDSLSILFRHVHRHYSRMINFREKWKGHLWQERFHSFVMSEQHLIASVRYVELNPVRARLCTRAEEWQWSSALDHLGLRRSTFLNTEAMQERITDWNAYLNEAEERTQLETIRRQTRTGRPSDEKEFLLELERLTGQELKKKKPGPKKID
jgi:putative transposase